MRSNGGTSSARIAWLVVVGLLAFMVAFAAGCGSDDDDEGDSGGEALTELGEGEGEVNLVAWAGYVEDGSTDPKVDWVTDFEQETGCKVNVKIGNTSDEMVQLMRTGQYDGVSASGDASGRLVEGGDVDPVNVDLIPNYEDVFDALKDQPYNTFDGANYGVPHGRGSNLLMYDPAEVKPAPTSWDVVFDRADEYSGQVTAYDNPIYIADAALYLREHDPELGITDPYELDQDQFDAAIELLKQQREHIGEYWSDYTKEIQAFANGDSSVGTTWQVIANLLNADGSKEKVLLPEEGATGWSDTWMLSSEAEHPNCMYMWMDHIISPEANAAVAEWFGEAPANEKSCALTADKEHCDIYHADDEAFFDQIEYWKTPVSDCGDDRGDVCKTYDEWVQGWNEVKG
ncbi:MAG: extracellular solute-binding protein [Solirubrobacterales bacterium]|jgi:putative spermidine/putrescine transport system substrate-binding protein|nr:extracellular solute-binding protein [Solirubrobacterales bacterium]